MTHWFWPSLKRELKTSWSRLSLSAVCLFLATAALSSIILTDSRLEQQTRRQAETILGGDIEVSDVRLLPETLLEKLQSSARIERKTRITSFITMMSATSNGRPRLVETVAIEDSWPLVPGIKVIPLPSHDALRKGGVWVEKALADNLGLQIYSEKFSNEIGEKLGQKLVVEKKAIRIGKKVFPVVGLVENDQMRDFASFAVGARIYMARETALQNRFVSGQSRLRDRFVLRFAPGSDLASGKNWVASEIEYLGAAKPNLRSKDDALNSAFKPAKSLFLFYDAVGFSVLILLGLGCAQGIHSYLARKHADAHILSMLGAEKKQIAALYIGNVLVVTVLALTLGTWAGFYAFDSFLLPRLSLWTPGLSVDTPHHDLLSLSLRFVGGLLLLISSLVLPGAMLFFRRKLPPASVGILHKSGYWSAIKSLASYLFSKLQNFPDLIWLIATFLLSFLISRETLLNLMLVVFLAAIYLLVRLSLKSLTRFGLTSRFRLPLFIRIASSEIASRPTQSALSLLLICLSVCLVVFLWDLRINIVNQLTDGFANGVRPNVFVLDSPPESEQKVRDILTQSKGEGIWSERLTRARLESINGKSSDEWLFDLAPKNDSEQRTKRMLNREQNLTTRKELGRDEEIVAGQFWTKESSAKNHNEASVEVGIAKLLNLNLGDQLTFNVQGVPVKVKITSLRRVRWQSFKPNFLFILHPSTLEDAPYSALIAATIRDSRERNDALSQLFKNHPGLTSIDANELSQLAGRIVGAALDIVRTLSVMLFIGALLNAILAAWSSFNTRAKHFSLYRCLGANNGLVMGACLAEFLILATVGCAVGLTASQALSAVVERSLLTVDDQLNVSLLPGLSVGTVVLVLSLIVGSISAVLILRQSPLRVIRRSN